MKEQDIGTRVRNAVSFAFRAAVNLPDVLDCASALGCRVPSSGWVDTYFGAVGLLAGSSPRRRNKRGRTKGPSLNCL